LNDDKVLAVTFACPVRIEAIPTTADRPLSAANAAMSHKP
jgi:hypothetical protein